MGLGAAVLSGSAVAAADDGGSGSATKHSGSAHAAPRGTTDHRAPTATSKRKPTPAAGATTRGRSSAERGVIVRPDTDIPSAAVPTAAAPDDTAAVVTTKPANPLIKSATSAVTPTANAAVSPFAGFLRSVSSLLGVNRPTAPANPIGALLWGLMQQVAAAVGVKPKAGTPTVSTPVGTTGLVTGTLGFTDSSGATLTYTHTDPANGTVTVNGDGTYSYTPTLAARLAAAGGTGPTTDSFSVTAFNGITSAKETVTVPISPDTPAIGTPTVGTPNSVTGAITGGITATDPAGQPLTYSVGTGPTKGAVTSFNSATGAFTYTPTTSAQLAAETAGAVGADSFTISVSNGAATVSVTVHVVVDPGAPQAGTPTIATTSTATGTITGATAFTDHAGGQLVYSVSGTPANGTATVSADGTYSYTPSLAARLAAAGGTGPITDSFTVTAGNGVHTTSQTISVAISPDTPVAGIATVGAPNAVTGAIAGTATATDPAGQPLTYSVGTGPTKGTITSLNTVTGAFIYTPSTSAQLAAEAAGTVGADTFTISASNGAASISVTVNVVVDPGTPQTGTPTAGTPVTSTGLVSGALGFTDPAGGTLTYTHTNPASGTVTIAADGTYSYTPTVAARLAAAGGTGPVTDTFTVTVTNGIHTASQTVTVAISPDTPVAGTPTVGAPNAVTGAITGTASVNDPAGQPLTYTITSGPASGTITNFNSSTGEFTYTPTDTAKLAAEAAGALGADAFIISASNGAASVSVTVHVVVDPGTPQTGTAVIGTVDTKTGIVTGTTAITDPAGGQLAYTVSAGPASGTVIVNSDGTYTYTPNAETTEVVDSFTVTATNGIHTTSQTISVPINTQDAIVGTWQVTGSDPAPAPYPENWVATITRVGDVYTQNITVTYDGVTDTFEYGRFTRTGAGVYTAVDGSYGWSADQELEYLQNLYGEDAVISDLVYNPYAVWSLNVSDDGQTITEFHNVTDTYTVTLPASHTLEGFGETSFTTDGVTNVYTFDDSWSEATFIAKFSDSTVLDIPELGTPIVGNPDPDTGVVIGNAVIIDPEGVTLVYSVSTNPAKGVITDFDTSTGEFVYTPDVDATGATDTFAVTATNGVYQATQTISVPLNPIAQDAIVGTWIIASATGQTISTIDYLDGSGPQTTDSGPQEFVADIDITVTKSGDEYTLSGTGVGGTIGTIGGVLTSTGSGIYEGSLTTGGVTAEAYRQLLEQQGYVDVDVSMTSTATLSEDGQTMTYVGVIHLAATGPYGEESAIARFGSDSIITYTATKAVVVAPEPAGTWDVSYIVYNGGAGYPSEPGDVTITLVATANGYTPTVTGNNVLPFEIDVLTETSPGVYTGSISPEGVEQFRQFVIASYLGESPDVSVDASNFNVDASATVTFSLDAQSMNYTIAYSLGGTIAVTIDGDTEELAPFGEGVSGSISYTATKVVVVAPEPAGTWTVSTVDHADLDGSNPYSYSPEPGDSIITVTETGTGYTATLTQQASDTGIISLEISALTESSPGVYTGSITPEGVEQYRQALVDSTMNSPYIDAISADASNVNVDVTSTVTFSPNGQTMTYTVVTIFSGTYSVTTAEGTTEQASDFAYTETYTATKAGVILT